MNRRAVFLAMGDLAVIFGITLFGFAAHGELRSEFLLHFAAAFLPLSISWLILAPRLGLYNAAILITPKELWRPAFGTLFAGPVAMVLRGLILNSPILPIFAVVLSAVCAAGLTIWRVVYFMIWRSSGKPLSAQ